jgi:hypothetical protein
VQVELVHNIVVSIIEAFRDLVHEDTDLRSTMEAKPNALFGGRFGSTTSVTSIDLVYEGAKNPDGVCHGVNTKGF